MTKLRTPNRLRSRRGLTIVELMVATFLAASVGIMATSTSIMVGRSHKAIFNQQQILKASKESIEALNTHIRAAVAPLTVRDDDGAAALQGNTVEFTRTDGTRGSFYLDPGDLSLQTPWNNRLIYDNDADAEGDEIVIAEGLAPTDAAGAFSYTGATTPLVVQMRGGSGGIG